MSVVCQECAASLEDSVVACPECGATPEATLGSARACAECGDEFRPAYAFCRGCGAPNAVAVGATETSSEVRQIPAKVQHLPISVSASETAQDSNVPEMKLPPVHGTGSRSEETATRVDKAGRRKRLGDGVRNLFWPRKLNQNPSGFTRFGRVLHWIGAAIFFPVGVGVLIGVGVGAFQLVTNQVSYYGTPLGPTTLAVSLGIFTMVLALYLTSRALRYIFSGE